MKLGLYLCRWHCNNVIWMPSQLIWLVAWELDRSVYRLLQQHWMLTMQLVDVLPGGVQKEIHVVTLSIALTSDVFICCSIPIFLLSLQLPAFQQIVWQVEYMCLISEKAVFVPKLSLVKLDLSLEVSTHPRMGVNSSASCVASMGIPCLSYGALRIMLLVLCPCGWNMTI